MWGGIPCLLFGVKYNARCRLSKQDPQKALLSTTLHLHIRSQTAPLTAKPQEFSPWLSALSNRAFVKGTAPCLPQFVKNPHKKSQLLRAPYPNSALAPSPDHGGLGGGELTEGKRVGRSPGGGQSPSLVPPARGSLQSQPRPSPHPRARQPAPAAHSGAPSPLPGGAVTSAAGAGVRLQAAPHPSARAREPCLPWASSGPQGGGAAVGGFGGQDPLALGRLPPGPRRFPRESRPDTADPRAFALHSLSREWGEERQGREGERCGRLATAARPGKRLCAATR